MVADECDVIRHDDRRGAFRAKRLNVGGGCQAEKAQEQLGSLVGESLQDTIKGFVDPGISAHIV